MMTFIRERLLFFIVIVFISAFLGVGILSVDRKNKQVHRDCEEYQDSIYLLNYKISQLEIKVGSLLLKIEESEVDVHEEEVNNRDFLETHRYYPYETY